MQQPDTKTALIIQLLAAGLDKPSIQVRVGCSQALVYKVLRNHAEDIARLKTGQPPVAEKPVHGPQIVYLPPPAPRPNDRPVAVLPRLDPGKPVAVQLEQFAWGVIAEAAAGGDITVKQANAAREIIHQALRDKQPAPMDRKMRFRISEIDVAPPDSGHDYTVVESKVFEVKP